MDIEHNEEPQLPLQYSFVLPSNNNDCLNNVTKLTAFQQMVDSGSTEIDHEQEMDVCPNFGMEDIDIRNDVI